jgi:hypothetical protein
MRENIFRCRAFHAGLIAGALVLTPMLFSCTEDMESGVVENHHQQISFSISGLEANSSASTRADASESKHSTIEMDADEGEQPLYLHVSQSKDFSDAKGSSSAATRGEPISSVDDYSGQVAIYGYRYSGSWSESLTPNFFQNDSLLTDFQESVVTSYPWPGKDSLKFFAIPKWVYDAGATRTLTGSPSITYTVPEASADQPDIILASNRVSGDYYNTIPLSFKHIMTGVVIKLAADFPATAVSSIKFTGVLNAGTYSMADSTWTLESSTDDFTASGVDTVTVTSGAVNTIVGGANTFMLLPQTLPSDATLEITYTESGSSVTRRAVIGGTSWPMGTIVTYTLSKSDLEFTFVVTGPDNYTYAGGKDTCTVTSYNSNSEPVGWTAKFVDDEGNEIEQPYWVTEFTLSGDGSTTAVNYDATVAAQEGVTQNPHTDTLRAASSRGSSSDPYDLSAHDPDGNETAVNTANCYVVNAPGYYSLPLVYGNGVEGGNTNTEAFYYPLVGAQHLDRLVDYNGNGITDPYISGADTASLVWEDVRGLVTNVGISNGKLVFNVPQSTIAQGNAVVAVKDASGAIMWSWHIWVTDYVLGTDVKARTRNNNETFHFLPYNLGWVDGEETNFAERSVKVKFTQNQTGATETITITQDPATMNTTGNSPYYQWGRKDPMLPSTGYALVSSVVKREAANKTWYDDGDYATVGSTELQIQEYSSSECITQGIRNPFTFIQNDDMDGNYRNLWAIDKKLANSSIDVSTSVKSIYDPCPYGYKVPVTCAFYGFSTDEENVTVRPGYETDDDLRGRMNVSMRRWELTCDDGSTLYLQNLGCRQVSDGVVVTSDVYGYYWYSIGMSVSQGFYMLNRISFDPSEGYLSGGGQFGFKYTSSTSGKGRGCSILPIVDENPE